MSNLTVKLNKEETEAYLAARFPKEAIQELFSGVDDMDAIFMSSLEVPETEEDWEYWDVCAFFTVKILGEDDEV